MGFTETEFNQGVQVWASTLGLRSDFGHTIDWTKVTAAADGSKSFDRAVLLAESDNNYARIAPRSTTTAAVTTATAVIPAKDPSVFVAGDILRTVLPSGNIAFTGTWAADDSVTITINSIDWVYSISGFTDLAALANEVALAFNNGHLNSLYTATATGDEIVISSKDPTHLHTFAVADASAGTATASVATLASNQLIGTVASVDVAAGTVTLAANAAVALPIGMPFGAPAKILGLTARAIDSEISPSEQGAFYSGTVYRRRMHHYDSSLEFLFPEIKFVEGVD